MEKKNLTKTLKKWLAAILSSLLVITLFGIIFVQLELVELSSAFFVELGVTLMLNIMMKFWWYDYTEDRVLSDELMKKEIDNYYSIVDDSIKDSNQLDSFVAKLNEENKQHYIKRKIGLNTPEKMANKSIWLCLKHWSYFKKTPEEIGEIEYKRLVRRYEKKADRLPLIKTEEIIALSNSNELLYDSKNYMKQRKREYQFSSSLLTGIFTTLFAAIAFKSISMNWENVFRFCSYLCGMIWTTATTILKASKTTETETLDYINRLKFIVDKYTTFNEKNGGISDESNSK